MNVERTQLGPGFRKAYAASLFVGGAGMVVAILVGYFADPTLRRFYFAYLISFAFFLSISVGALFFVLIQHLTRAGWSVGTRRVAETLGCMMPVLAALAAPVVVSVITQKGDLYRWAQPAHMQEAKASLAEAGDAESVSEVVEGRRAWLNPARFVSFVIGYFAVWSLIGVWYWRSSVKQDSSNDESLTRRMQALAAPAMVAFAITVTLAAFDLLMSLDPAWFSTIFGVYFFSGSAVAIFATLIVAVYVLQRAGYLAKAVTIEHYHDLGKFLFGFTFFWGYIAFSQYMLLWYANIPETTEWFSKRGATTVAEHVGAWSVISLILLFGQLLLPFAGLLSRHVKRNKGALVFWAIWLLAFHWLDLYWLIMPELDGKLHMGLIELACFVGIGGIYLAALLRIALRHSVRPLADPRLHESLVFENI
jgi:hypothetical protein